MFNGIIYNQGIIKKIIKRPKGLNIFIKSDLNVTKKDMGLSVACDGVCLTLISYQKKTHGVLSFERNYSEIKI